MLSWATSRASFSTLSWLLIYRNGSARMQCYSLQTLLETTYMRPLD
jgi:hypothetical protein